MESVNLGILGMGTVASGLINIIDFNNRKIVGTIDKQLVINKVLVKDVNKKRNVNLPLNAYTTDAYEIINNEDINLLKEILPFEFNKQKDD